MFSRFDTIPECDRQTHRHTTTAYTALSIASRGKNDSPRMCMIVNYVQLVDDVLRRTEIVNACLFEAAISARERNNVSPPRT